VPERFKACMDSWKIMHPDWLYILWTDEKINHIKLYNQALFDRAINYAQRSDILRYELLYHYGGLYVDVDFRCLKPFDFLHHSYDFYIGIMNTGVVELGNALIGSAPNHPILKEIITNIRHAKIKSFNDFVNATGNAHVSKSFMNIAPHYTGPIIVLPCSFFYPLPNTERFLTQEKQDTWIRPESFAIHYWACSWQKKEAFIVQ